MSDDWETDFDEILAFIDDELERVSWYADWYKQHAKKIKVKYLSLRIPLIVLGVIVPQLVALQALYDSVPLLTVVAIVTATLVAVLAGLDTFFRYGELYVDDKAAELSLYAISRKYARERLTVTLELDPQLSLDKADALLDSLRNEYEQVVGGTTGAYLKRTRTAASKRPEKATS
jgi:hypothetical protein